MGSYCPGIPYYDTCDFSKECLIASVIQGARPTYANSNTITRLSWGEDHFVFEYDNNPANYIYALNGDNGTHYYVEVIIVVVFHFLAVNGENRAIGKGNFYRIGIHVVETMQRLYHIVVLT